MIDTPENSPGGNLNSAYNVRYITYKINNVISILLYLTVFGDFAAKYVKERWCNRNAVVPFEASVHTIDIEDENQFGNPEDNPDLASANQEPSDNFEHVRFV